MAAPNFLAGAAFVRLYFTFQGQLGIMQLGMQVTGAPTFDQSLADQVGAAIKGHYTTHMVSQQANNVSLARVGTRDWRTPNKPEFRDQAAAVVGTAVGDPLPRSVALCVTLRTDEVGRSARGRVYFGGFPESANDSSALTLAAASTACTAFLAAVKTSLIPLGLTHAVISKPAEAYTIVKTTTHTDGTTSTDTLVKVNAKAGAVREVKVLEARTNTWESQRRRDNGRGGQAAIALNPISRIEV